MVIINYIFRPIRTFTLPYTNYVHSVCRPGDHGSRADPCKVVHLAKSVSREDGRRNSAKSSPHAPTTNQVNHPWPPTPHKVNHQSYGRGQCPGTDFCHSRPHPTVSEMSRVGIEDEQLQLLWISDLCRQVVLIEHRLSSSQPNTRFVCHFIYFQ